MKQTLLIFLLFIATMASTIYVKDDQFKIVLRSQPASNGRFVAELPAGTAMTVLPGSTNGWKKVRVNNSGKIGYIISSFAMDREPWQKQYEDLNKSTSEAQSKIDNLTKDKELLQRNYKALEDSLAVTTKKLEKANGKIKALSSKEIKIWVLLGAALMFLGWIMAHISLPKGKKKNRW